MVSSNLTPMFRQYQTLKQEEPDSVLLFRMGDFYELFFEDAKQVAPLLELTLTARGRGTDNVVPMCGFPHHQLTAYTARLVRANFKVAICDQVEDPKLAKGLVRREIVRVVTPGTVNDPTQIDAKVNLWIAAVARGGGKLGAAFLDASTGELLAWEASSDGDCWERLAERLRTFEPREVVYPEGLEWPNGFRDVHLPGRVVTESDPYAFSPGAAELALKEHFGVASLDGFGLRDRRAAVAAAAGLLGYVGRQQRSALSHVIALSYHEPRQFLLLDPATQRNLELERSIRDGSRTGSVLAAIDRTVTSAGGRLLRRWIASPLLDSVAINERLDAVGEFVRDPASRTAAREQLAGVHDIERLLARVVAGSASPRDLNGLRSSLERLPSLIEEMAAVQARLIRELVDGIDPCPDVASRIARGLIEEPPVALREGGFIRDGFDNELDELRSIRLDGKSFIAGIERAEREKSGIPSLKVKFNRVFGYFIEITKANVHLVPEHYHRKQTIANGERYVTPELKEYEAKILKAQERIEQIEIELFQKLRTEVAAEAPRIKRAAEATACLDVLLGYAESAATQRYCRPTVDDGARLRIVGGRHPVVEQALEGRRFVPNDSALEASKEAIAILTGPNMGGKSTYLRQVALITLLAQAGSYVPAEEASVGVVDRIFCRVGASDSLAEGQSTFMVEMTETANILHHATSRSLILLDEIGRGTSTFDGLSLAWAVVEHLTSIQGGAPRALFATHYHELTELARERACVFNLRMAVREKGDQVAFLHRVERGAADRSYGIHVARLAGIPESVVNRAQEILENIERDEWDTDGQPKRARRRESAAGSRRQPSLFEEPRALDAESLEVLAALRDVITEEMTPLDALNRIAEWKRRLNQKEPSASPSSR